MPRSKKQSILPYDYLPDDEWFTVKRPGAGSKRAAAAVEVVLEARLSEVSPPVTRQLKMPGDASLGKL
ncbi:MAG: hypothetical protein AB1758_23455, partial [Candidatus Eremiobacterota bacterium]